MIGLYNGAAQRRFVPQGVNLLKTNARFFDGREESFIADNGPSRKAMVTGAAMREFYPFLQLNDDNGEHLFDPSSKGRNRPGVRIQHLASAPVAQSPFVSFTARDNGGNDAEWTVAFVFSFDAIANGRDTFEFSCDTFSIYFKLYTNGVILSSLSTSDGGGNTSLVSLSGVGGVAIGPAYGTPTFASAPVYAVIVSRRADGFRYRQYALDSMEVPDYSAVAAWPIPDGTIADLAPADATGMGVFYIGKDDNHSPSADCDFICHEAFYQPSGVDFDGMDELAAHWHRKWFVKS